ncbi:hypothetical protein DFH08DRAFT_817581 [Mycena albidolilacea]|uniref:Uncharacterized protein n=1 Tax=Mycena albidolilacea TaxID=1033008 RepID=A0AAD6ZJ37_9AGAR|nr:hypothetical protein DFH08DRAFT_817581 [Mycena albidolilacea]
MSEEWKRTPRQVGLFGVEKKGESNKGNFRERGNEMEWRTNAMSGGWWRSGEEERKEARRTGRTESLPPLSTDQTLAATSSYPEKNAYRLHMYANYARVREHLVPSAENKERRVGSLRSARLWLTFVVGKESLYRTRMGHKGRDGGTWETKIKGGSGLQRRTVRTGARGWWMVEERKEEEKDKEDETYFLLPSPPASTSLVSHAQSRDRWLGVLGVRVYMALKVEPGKGELVQRECGAKGQKRERLNMECGMRKRNDWMESHTTEKRTTEGVGMEEVECGVDWDCNRPKIILPVCGSKREEKTRRMHGERAACPSHPIENVRESASQIFLRESREAIAKNDNEGAPQLWEREGMSEAALGERSYVEITARR